MLISYKTLYSILLGHFTLHFTSHFHQELFPQIPVSRLCGGGGGVHLLSCIRFLAMPRTIACLVLLSMRFSRQEYWSRLPFPSPVWLKFFKDSLHKHKLFSIKQAGKKSKFPANIRKTVFFALFTKTNLHQRYHSCLCSSTAYTLIMITFKRTIKIIFGVKIPKAIGHGLSVSESLE